MPGVWSDVRINNDQSFLLNDVFRGLWPRGGHQQDQEALTRFLAKAFSDWIAEQNKRLKTLEHDRLGSAQMAEMGIKKGKPPAPIVPFYLDPDPIVTVTISTEPGGWRTTYVWVQILSRAAALDPVHRLELAKALVRPGDELPNHPAMPAERLERLPAWARLAWKAGWSPGPWWMP